MAVNVLTLSMVIMFLIKATSMTAIWKKNLDVTGLLLLPV